MIQHKRKTYLKPAHRSAPEPMMVLLKILGNPLGAQAPNWNTVLARVQLPRFLANALLLVADLFRLFRLVGPGDRTWPAAWVPFPGKLRAAPPFGQRDGILAALAYDSVAAGFAIMCTSRLAAIGRGAYSALLLAANSFNPFIYFRF
jgi:hypothetical protein